MKRDHGTRYYVGSIDGKQKVVCEKHLPKLKEDQRQYVGRHLICFYCQAEDKIQKSLLRIVKS